MYVEALSILRRNVAEGCSWLPAFFGHDIVLKSIHNAQNEQDERF